jgi:hypothetical protein
VHLHNKIFAQQPEERVKVWLAGMHVRARIGRHDVAERFGRRGDLRQESREWWEGGESSRKLGRATLKRSAGAVGQINTLQIGGLGSRVCVTYGCSAMVVGMTIVRRR